MVLKRPVPRWPNQAVKGQTSRQDVMDSLETAACVRRRVIWTRSVSESISHANC